LITLSRAGAAAILGHEAIYLEAYPDPVGVWTIGAGHTAAAGGLKPRAGQLITLQQAMELFQADMGKYEAGVRSAVRTQQQQEFDGFTSFHFNTGAVKTGTVDDKWNAGDRAGAMRTLQSYVNAKGKRLPGLVTRRKEEAAMITSGQYPARKILVRDRKGAQGRLVSVDQLPWGRAALPVNVDKPLATPAPRRVEKPNFLLDLARYIGRALSWI
jgi:lysozyme